MTDEPAWLMAFRQMVEESRREPRPDERLEAARRRELARRRSAARRRAQAPPPPPDLAG